MRKVELGDDTPPKDWIKEANVLTTKLYKITEIFDAGNLTLAPDLAAKADMPDLQADSAVLGEVKGRLQLQISNENSELIFDEAEGFLSKDRAKRVARIRELLPDNWDEPIDDSESAELLMLLKQISRLGFTERNATHWRDDRVRKWLLEKFGEKCWYSEAADSVSPIHVDHYRPKSSVEDDASKEKSEGYWWLAFDWTNYRISGHVINSKKGNYFPLHLSLIHI